MKVPWLLVGLLSMVFLEDATKKIKGTIKMNGHSYTSVCQCNNLHDTKACHPSDLRLVKDRGNGDSNPHLIRELLGTSNFIIKEITRTRFSCIDGRLNGANMYSVGGDVGSLLIAFSLYEMSINRELTKKEIKAGVESYINIMKQDYLSFSIDTTARDYLIKAAGQDTVNLARPKQALRQKLLPYVSKAEAQGDLFFRVLKKYKSKFGVKSNITELFIQSIYEILWELADKAQQTNDKQLKLRLEILQGEHQEKAFIDIRLGTACKTNLAGPVLPTRSSKISVYVHSFDAALIKLEYIGKFVTSSVSHGKLSEKIFLNRLNNRYLSYFNQMGLLVASSLDFYTASLVMAQK